MSPIGSSLQELAERAWQEWFAEMTGEQGQGYYEDFKDDLQAAFDAGFHYAQLLWLCWSQNESQAGAA